MLPQHHQDTCERLVWFIRFSEFAEVTELNESSAPFRKNSNTVLFLLLAMVLFGSYHSQQNWSPAVFILTTKSHDWWLWIWTSSSQKSHGDPFVTKYRSAVSVHRFPGGPFCLQHMNGLSTTGKFHYRSWRSCKGYVFTGVCLSTVGGVCLSTCWDTTPWEQAPPTPRSRYLCPGADPREQTPPRSRHPPGRDGHCWGRYTS